MKKLNKYGKTVATTAFMMLLLGGGAGALINQSINDTQQQEYASKINRIKSKLNVSLSINYYDSIQAKDGGKTPTFKQLKDSKNQDNFLKYNTDLSKSDLNQWLNLLIK